MSEKTPAERFKSANEAVSEHCFKVGRLRYDIELEEENLETKRREYKNMRVEFDRLRKEFNKAFDEVNEASKASLSKQEDSNVLDIRQ